MLKVGCASMSRCAARKGFKLCQQLVASCAAGSKQLRTHMVLIADHVLPLQEALAVDRQEVMRRSGHANRFAPCKDVANYARQVTVYLRLSLPCEEMHAA